MQNAEIKEAVSLCTDRKKAGNKVFISIKPNRKTNK